MIFPIGDDQVKGGAPPVLSYTFIALNILIFGYEATLMSSPERINAFIMEYGAIPIEIMGGVDYHTLISSMFLHGGWMHLIGNMLFLWVFADNIEASVGHLRFLLFYVLGGIAAAGAHILLNPTSQIPMVGASGAISAVLGAYLVMFPKSRVKVLVIYLFSAFYVPAILFLGFWIVQQLVSGFASLGPVTADTAGTAWWAHIGGFVFGLLAGFIFRQGPTSGQLARNTHAPYRKDGRNRRGFFK